MRRQVDDLVDKLENLQKRLNTSQKKTRRRNKKVSTLTAVVSELREKNLKDYSRINVFWSSEGTYEEVGDAKEKEKYWGVST